MSSSDTDQRAFEAAWKICSAWDGKITKPVLRKVIAAALKEIEIPEAELSPDEFKPMPRGGIETDWHAACILLRRRFRKLEKAARAVVKATDDIHDNDPFPIKYRAPYGAIMTLRETLAEVGTQYPKEPTP